MNSFFSAKIVPIFYISIGLIFLIFPEIPQNDISLEDSNSKYYFNPYTLKIEPITTDQMAWRGNADYKPAELNSKYINILSNQKFIEKLPINLKKISQ